MDTVISGNIPVGDCCICDKTDSSGRTHVDQYTLYKCANPDCSHWACKQHLIEGLCEGCYYDMGR